MGNHVEKPTERTRKFDTIAMPEIAAESTAILTVSAAARDPPTAEPSRMEQPDTSIPA